MTCTQIRRFLPLLLGIALLAAASTAASAAVPVRASCDQGTTIIDVGGFQVEVETSAPIIVNLSLRDGSLQGSVELPAGTSSATVKMKVLGPPDEVIFDGRVFGTRFIRKVLPSETGQGEM